MPPFAFTWSVLGTDGLKFQELCRDLFRREGFEAEILAPGGHDRGRDIEIFRPDPTRIGISRRADWWVECKSRTSGAGVNHTELSPNFIWALLENIPRLIFVTNHRLTNEARDMALRFNTMKPRYLAVSTIQQLQLETWISAYPDLYVKYFAPTTDASTYPPAIGLKPVEIRCSIDSLFFDDEPRIIAHARNISFRSQKAILRVGDKTWTLNLEPIDEIIEEIPIASHGNVRAEVAADSCPADVIVEALGAGGLSVRIDRIFADPLDHVTLIGEALSGGSHLFLGGAAGMGKTRLLREAARRAKIAPRLIDLSYAGYRYSLAEHLVMITIGLDMPILDLLSREAVGAILRRRGCDQDLAALVATFVKRESEGIDAPAMVGAIVSSFENLCDERVLFLDNIHRFSALDLQVFERLLRQTDAIVVCTARDNEIEIPSTAYAIEEQIDNGAMVRIDLEPNDLRTRISTFLNAAAADADTGAFLAKYGVVGSFHELMLSLKQLRMLGIVTQDQTGHFYVDRSCDRRPVEHQRAYQALMKSVQITYESERVESILQLAATYNIAFPDALITSTLGDCSDLIDRLILDEILINDRRKQPRIPGVTMLRFDHELTRELVLKGTPPMRRKRWHEAVIAYLAPLGASHALYSPRLLSEQYEQINDLPNAIAFSNAEAGRQTAFGQLADAYTALERSINLIAELNTNSRVEIDALEGDTLIDLISVGRRLRGTEAMRPYIEQLAINLRIAYDDARGAVLNGLLAAVEGEHFNYPEALKFLDAAMTTYRRLENAPAYARALNEKGGIMKRMGASPAETLRIHRDALLRFRVLGDIKGVAESLAAMGAVLLECGRGGKTVFWWRRGADILRSSAERTSYCYHLADLAYINALFRPDDPQNLVQLKASLSLARKLDMQPIVCRACINLANFVGFGAHIDNADAALDLANEAVGIARSIKDGYLEILALFSVDALASAAGRPNSERDHLMLMLNKFPKANLANLRDNRVINIAKYAALHCGPEGLRFAAQFKRSDLDPFLAGFPTSRIDEIEAGNPYYRRGGFYATYY